MLSEDQIDEIVSLATPNIYGDYPREKLVNYLEEILFIVDADSYNRGIMASRKEFHDKLGEIAVAVANTVHDINLGFKNS